ncbi:MAG TPA: hypothetical protein VFF12_13455, partial [Myxococcaceae bacterium]|nr:hypothetical protein [Myxococcaceae bacterium]
GDLTGNVTWDLFSGNAGTLSPSTSQTVQFTPTDLGTPGGAVLVRATATVGGTTQPATAAVQVVPSTHGRIALGIDPGGAVGSVDITDPVGGSKTTFVANAPTVLRSKIIDAGTYTVTADAGILVQGSLVDGTWDGTASFDGGTPARSIQVPVLPNAQTNVAVTFALSGFLGRAWLPVSGGIVGYTETDILVDHTNVTPTGISAGGALAVAFDADGNLWATFADGNVRMYTPAALNTASPQATKTVAVPSPTGIAIRGNVVAVGSCTGTSTGAVSTFDRTLAAPTATAGPINVGCVWGLSFDAGDNGKLFVVSRSGGKLYRFTTATSGTVDPGFTTASIADAYGIAVDGTGNAWVSSCNGNSVQEVPPSGTPVGAAISLTDFPCPGGLAIDKQGGLWALSAGGGSGSSGSLVSISGGTPTSQLNSLTDVTFGGFAFEPAGAGLPTHQ